MDKTHHQEKKFYRGVTLIPALQEIQERQRNLVMRYLTSLVLVPSHRHFEVLGSLFPDKKDHECYSSGLYRVIDLRAHHRRSVRSGHFPGISRHLKFAYRLSKTKVSVIT